MKTYSIIYPNTFMISYFRQPDVLLLPLDENSYFTAHLFVRPAQVQENIDLRKENNDLKTENAALLKRIVELQDKLIEAMNGSSKNQRPKVSE